jgi:hypothetical protein
MIQAQEDLALMTHITDLKVTAIALQLGHQGQAVATKERQAQLLTLTRIQDLQVDLTSRQVREATMAEAQVQAIADQAMTLVAALEDHPAVALQVAEALLHLLHHHLLLQVRHQADLLEDQDNITFKKNKNPVKFLTKTFGGVFYVKFNLKSLNLNTMKKYLIPILSLIFMQVAHAQLSLNGHFYGEDALKFNTFNPSVGTAKVIGMGGSFTALGADATNAYLNPAGLGFYNKSEFSISPVFGNYNSNSKYIGISTATTSSDLKMGQLAVVFSSRGAGTLKKRSAWSLAYNNLANFQSNYNYSGSNNKSSIADYFAQKASSRNIKSADLDKEFNSSTIQADNITALAYQSYLIEPIANNYYEPFELYLPADQSGNVSTKGNLNQINLSYGVNYDNKTYLGFGIGLQNLSHTVLTQLTESFAKGETFNKFRFSDELYTSGTGLNINIGTIYKITEDIRIGVAITSPTAMRTSETYIGKVVIDPKPNTVVTPNKSITTVPNDFSYRITSPLRASSGLSFFLPKKLGAINFDVEYIGYSKMGIKDSEDATWSSDQKQGIQNQFKDVINLKAGAELRFGNARLRGGLAYNQNPNKNQSAILTKATLIGSLGAGFRTERFFGDVAFNASKSTFGYTPYTVSNPADYASVAVNSKNTMVAFTIGTFF